MSPYLEDENADKRIIRTLENLLASVQALDARVTALEAAQVRAMDRIHARLATLARQLHDHKTGLKSLDGSASDLLDRIKDVDDRVDQLEKSLPPPWESAGKP